MAKTAIAGGRIGTIKNLKKTLKSSGGGPLSWIPKEGITVRFLTEPDDWFGFYEHYDETIRSSYPCIEGDCPGCSTDQRRTFRYVANVLDVENDVVKALLIPKSLANRLTARYERNDTLIDRDYELFKTGEGLDTDYDLNPESPKKRALSKYELIDLGDALQQTWDAQWGETDEEDEDDEDETPRRRRRTATGTSKTRRRRKADDEDDEEDEDEEDEEDDEDDEDDELTITVEELEDLDLAGLKEIAGDFGISVKPDKGKKRVSAAQLRSRIIDELELDDDEDEDEDLDDEEDFEDEDDFDDEDEDEVDEDDEYELWEEDELSALSMTELREIARDYGIKTQKMKKAALIEAILEAQEE